MVTKTRMIGYLLALVVAIAGVEAARAGAQLAEKDMCILTGGCPGLCDPENLCAPFGTGCGDAACPNGNCKVDDKTMTETSPPFTAISCVEGGPEPTCVPGTAQPCGDLYNCTCKWSEEHQQQECIKGERVGPADKTYPCN